MKFSACWIVKNEAANIGRSIESVMDVVDEIIVVDTGSTDDTVKIAESYGARVEFFEWTGDFAAARNFAISYVTGDLFFFLDADEYFEKRLTPADRVMLEGHLNKNLRLEMFSFTIINIDVVTGRIIATAIVTRLFRNIKTNRFQGRIHEFIKVTHMYANLHAEEFNIIHTGYSDDIISGKISRNYTLLEDELNKDDTSIQDRVRYSVYAMRELHVSGSTDRAADHLQTVLGHPKVLQEVCAAHSLSFVYNMEMAIKVAAARRDRVSRLDINRKLIGLFKTQYKEYAGTAEIDLIYQVFFDFKEDRLLRELEPAVKVAADKSKAYAKDYKKLEKLLYTEAAYAAHRRGDLIHTMEYAAAAFAEGANRNNSALLFKMLTALKGQKPQDIALLLNSIFDITKPEELHFLIHGTGIEGFREVHAYYLKKRIELGDASPNILYRWMLLRGSYAELFAAVADAYEAGRTDDAQYIFQAALCGAPTEWIDGCVGILGDYVHILRAFYAGGQLESVTPEDSRILGDTYMTIAFIAGLEAAERFLNVFRADSALCYWTKAQYCEMNGHLEWLLQEDMEGIGRLNFNCYKYRIQALLNAGRYDEAVWEMKIFLDQEVIEAELLYMLLVAAEKGTGGTAEKARKLYDQYIEIIDAIIDLTDVVNTEIIYEQSGGKQKQLYKTMNRIKFDELMKEEAARPATSALLNISRRAAAVYKEKGAPAEAVRCMLRVVAHGPQEKRDYENLAELFEDLNNVVLPEYIKNLIPG